MAIKKIFAQNDIFLINKGKCKKMTYSIEPAYTVKNELSRMIMKAGTEKENKWFFTDGAFNADAQLESSPNTWCHENFVVIYNKKIVAYFESPWNKVLNIINGFRFILFDKSKSIVVARAFFQYLDYLFIVRGAKSIFWIVAEKNEHAYKLYEKFTQKYCGHKIGKKHYGQMGYDGEVSDVCMYELTKEEFLIWKNRNIL